MPSICFPHQRRLSGVKSVTDSAKVIVHISNGFDNNLFRWVFDGLTSNGAQFDVIGMSLFTLPPATGRPWMQCLANMNDMVSRYGKPVLILKSEWT